MFGFASATRQLFPISYIDFSSRQ